MNIFRWPQAGLLAGIALLGLLFYLGGQNRPTAGGADFASARVTASPATSPPPTKTRLPVKTPRPSATPRPTQTKPGSKPESFLATLAAPTLTIADGDCVPAHTQQTYAHLTRVIDGDTIEVELAGQVYRVRYIGVDAPESNDDSVPFEQEARQKNLDLLQNQEVLLIKDVSETDPYGRLLRYVFAGQVFVNYQMVRQGYAQPKRYEPDVSCAGRFEYGQEMAKREKLGLWAVRTALESAPGPGESMQNSAQGLGCDPSYPEVCIPPPPPDLDCGDIEFRRFQVSGVDPHRFDRDRNGLGCER